MGHQNVIKCVQKGKSDIFLRLAAKKKKEWAGSLQAFLHLNTWNIKVILIISDVEYSDIVQLLIFDTNTDRYQLIYATVELKHYGYR